MSSILKILVDTPCEVYCDYELKGDAVPQSIFIIEMSKGTYILEFKQNGNVLYSQEYIMQSNDEEDLLRIPLIEIINKQSLEERTKQIEQLNVSLEFHDKKYWIKSIDENTEKEIQYNLIDCCYYDPYFDACGLLRVYKGIQNEDGSMQKGSLIGCINKLGEIQIPLIFDYIYPFENPFTTIAGLNGQVVFINKWGEIAFENVYVDVIGGYHGKNCIVKKNGKKGVINERGEIILPLFFDDIEYTSGIQGFILTNNNKRGLCDNDGIVVIPTIYDNVENAGKGFVLVQNGNMSGIISDKGETIIPTRYNKIECDYWDLHGFIVTLNEKKGFFGSDGSEIISITYDDIQKICRGNLLVTNKNMKGVYTKSGKCILDIIYDSCESTFGTTGEKGGSVLHYFIVTLNGKVGLYDEFGEPMLGIEYDTIKELAWNHKLVQHINGWWQIFDVNNRDFLSGLFSEFFKGWGNQLITKWGGWGVYDDDKNVYLINPIYDAICKSSNGFCYVVLKSGKKGLYNDEGKLLYDVIYDDIEVREEVIVAILNGYVIIYDYDGNILLDKQYQIIPEISDGTGWAERGVKIDGWDYLFRAEPRIIKRNGKWGCINKDLWQIYKKQDVSLIKEYIPCEYDKIAYSNKEILTDSNLDKDDIIRYFVKEEANGDLHYYEYQLQNDIASIVNEWINPKNNTYYLFFDTETTGTPLNYKAPSSNTRNWPRLVQLGWILMTEDGEKVSKGNYIIKPDGFTIPVEASKIHKITTKMALELGYNLSYVIDKFLQDFNKAKYIVGHNIDFDKKIVGAELIRLSRPDIMDSKQAFCTMKSSTDFCKIPGYYGYKYPKLQELYHKLFGNDFEEAHNAASDIEATQQCFWELRRRKLI